MCFIFLFLKKNKKDITAIGARAEIAVFIRNKGRFANFFHKSGI
jgi:hypothetical protein